MRPLSAGLYLRRNVRRVLPLLLIQILVVGVMVAVVTVTNTVQATQAAYMRPLEAFTIVTPRNRSDFDEGLDALLADNPAGERFHRAKLLWMRAPGIFGDSHAPLMAVPPGERDRFLASLGLRLVEGTLPPPGSNGAAVHAAVMRGRGLSLGDMFGRDHDPADAVPGRFQVVGVLDGDARMGLVDYERADKAGNVLNRVPTVSLVFSASAQGEASNAWLRAAQTGSKDKAFHVLDAAFMQARFDRATRNVPLIIGFITGAVAFVMALVSALLYVIGFQSRRDEMALLVAVGIGRGRLLRRLGLEALWLALTGWLLGYGLGLLAVFVYDQQVLAPRGILMWLFEWRPVLYSLPVPILSVLVTAVALWRSLERLDPIQVLQRRGA